MQGTSSQLLVNVVTAGTIVGIVQFVTFLLRRKSELTALDRTSAAPLLEQQGAFADRLAQAETQALKRVEQLEAKLREREQEQLERDHDFTIQLNRVNLQNANLVTQVASLRNDIDIANLQLQEFRRRFGIQPPDGASGPST